MGDREIESSTLRCAQRMQFSANWVVGRIVIEACGSARRWARTLGSLGREVRLVHARHVPAYVRGNKNGATDARVIWSAARAPDLRWVPLRGGQQQAATKGALEVVRRTICRTHAASLASGVRIALLDVRRSGRPRRYDAKPGVRMTALACPAPPDGATPSSMPPLEKAARAEPGLQRIGLEVISRIPMKTGSSRGDGECGA